MTDPRPPASKSLVTTDWLAARLGKPGIAVVDGSFYLPALKRDAKAEFLTAHIPGAVFFDIDAVADHSTDLPHMLPGATMLSEEAGKLGITEDDTIVVYDGAGLGGAPRVWWTFRIFGAKNVFILDGGFPAWKAEGRPVEAGEAKPAPKTFKAEFDTSKVANTDDVSLALMNKSAQLVDARPAERFRGEAPEPRPGIRSGHMPGALNVPVTGLIENGRLIAPEKIAEKFKAGGVDFDKPTITTCGSGVTAATLWFALDAIGKPPQRLYDGSWTEWGGRADLPVTTKD
jgi:thiosulfate/3-mercaptopyruvate sulfurtransferase